jgi:hypothetical protein
MTSKIDKIGQKTSGSETLAYSSSALGNKKEKGQAAGFLAFNNGTVPMVQNGGTPAVASSNCGSFLNVSNA